MYFSSNISSMFFGLKTLYELLLVVFTRSFLSSSQNSVVAVSFFLGAQGEKKM